MYRVALCVIVAALAITNAALVSGQAVVAPICATACYERRLFTDCNNPQQCFNYAHVTCNRCDQLAGKCQANELPYFLPCKAVALTTVEVSPFCDQLCLCGAAGVFREAQNFHSNDKTVQLTYWVCKP